MGQSDGCFHGVLVQRIVFDDVIDQPHLQGRLGAGGLAGQVEFHGPAGADQAGQQIGRATVGRGADVGVGHQEPGATGGYPDVAAQRQAETGPRRYTVDAGHHRFLQTPQSDDHLVVQVVGQRSDVLLYPFFIALLLNLQ